MNFSLRWRRWSLLAAGVLAASSTWPHDSWFAPLPQAPQGQRLLALGTGNQFPKLEFAIAPEYLQAQGCVDAQGQPGALAAVRLQETSLLMTAPAAAVSCWMQLAPFEIQLPPDKIALYFDEVRPPAAVRQAWAALQARGLAWNERYTKHARVIWPGGQAAAPSMGMDARLIEPAVRFERGVPMEFEVLRDGQPLADQAVEFRQEDTRFGLWRRTNAQGRVSFTPPLPGQWILRAIDLRLSDTTPEGWDSRFLTVAFEVQAVRTATP